MMGKTISHTMTRCYTIISLLVTAQLANLYSSLEKSDRLVFDLVLYLVGKPYLAGPPCRFVFSSMPFHTMLFSSPVAGDFPMVKINRASKAFLNRLHNSCPAGLLGR